MVRHYDVVCNSFYRLNYLLGLKDHCCKLSEWCLRFANWGICCIQLRWFKLYSDESIEFFS